MDRELTRKVQAALEREFGARLAMSVSVESGPSVLYIMRIKADGRARCERVTVGNRRSVYVSVIVIGPISTDMQREIRNVAKRAINPHPGGNSVTVAVAALSSGQVMRRSEGR